MRTSNSNRWNFGTVFGSLLLMVAYVTPVAAYGAILGQFVGA
ncbi:hypothetical protein [Parvularcula oceani]|nr:hypothetical protein [Parvularcula oceani]